MSLSEATMVEDLKYNLLQAQQLIAALITTYGTDGVLKVLDEALETMFFNSRVSVYHDLSQQCLVLTLLKPPLGDKAIEP